MSPAGAPAAGGPAGSGIDPGAPLAGPAPRLPQAAQPVAGADTFSAALAEAVQRARVPPPFTLRLSGHAAQRLAQAGLSPDPGAWADVSRAVGRAAAKGSRQALVLWGDTALVVAVADRTVVTAVPAARMQDHVFTGIDSAVFVSSA